MQRRYLVTCMPGTEIAREIYEKVLKVAVPDSKRLSLMSYLDAATRDEFDREIRTWIHLSNGVIAIVNRLAHNVFYGVGVAAGFGKPVILLAPSLRDVPTMLRGRHVCVFQPKDIEDGRLLSKLEPILKAMLHGSFIDQRFQDHTSVLLSDPLANPDGQVFDDPDRDEPDELELGLGYYRSKSYDKSAIHLEKALRGGNYDPDTHYFLADSWFFLGESLNPGEKQRGAYQKMQHFAHEGIRLHATDKRLRKTFGLSCMKLGDFDRAEKIFLELLTDDPEYMVARYNLACLYALQQRKSHCLQSLLDVFSRNGEWRYLARLDRDFDDVWKDELIQRAMFPCPIKL